MEINSRCCCCLVRPADKHFMKPYTALDRTEIFSDMLKECFEISLIILPYGNECGICEVCVSRLRDASDFKLQVQRSQAELQARLPRATCVKEEETLVKLEMSDDGVKEELIEDFMENGEVEDLKPEILEDPLPNVGSEDSCVKLKHEIAPSAVSEVTSQLEREQSTRAQIVRSKRRCVVATGNRGSSRVTHTSEHAHQQTKGTKPHQTSIVRAETENSRDTSDRQLPDNRLVNHQRSHKSTVLSCPVCNKQFMKKYHLDVHITSHTSDQPIGCTQCNKLFAHRSYLNRHIRLRHTRKPKEYKCSECNKEFSKRSNLIRHGTIHTGENPYTCKKCNKEFRDSTSFNYHKHTLTGGARYICDICKMQYKQKVSLIAHIGEHMGRELFSCTFCKIKFWNYKQLYKHRRVHSGEKYRCEECNIGFTAKPNCTDHIMKVHAGENPYTCEFCNAQLTSRSGLYRHKKTHTGARLYPCKTCDKRFLNKQRCIEHERIHTGEKPHCCEVCGKQFARQNSLSTHLKTHVVGEKYSCELCPKFYATRESLRQHKRVHTNDKDGNRPKKRTGRRQ